MAMEPGDVKRITIVISSDVHSKLAALAVRDKRSLSQELAWLLEKAVEDKVAPAQQEAQR